MPPYAYPPQQQQYPPPMMQGQGQQMVPQQFGQQWGPQGQGGGGQAWHQQQQGQAPDGSGAHARFGGPRPPHQSPGMHGFTGCHICRKLDHIASNCPTKSVKEENPCALPCTSGRGTSRGYSGKEGACATSKSPPRSQVSGTGGASWLPSEPLPTRPIEAKVRDAREGTRFRAALSRVCEGAAGAECSWPPGLGWEEKMGWEETLAGTEAAVVFADAVERVGDGMGSGDDRERGE